MGGAAVRGAPLATAGAKERRPYRTLSLRAKLTQRWLVLNILATAASLAANVWHYQVLQDRDMAAYDASVARVGLFALVEAVVYVIGVAIFIAWFFRAYSNLEALGYHGRYGRWWAVAGWFVPIMWLFRPKEIANDIWRSADPDPPGPEVAWWDRPVSRLLGVWWTTWLVTCFTAWMAFRAPIDTIEEDRDATTLTMLSEVLWILAAVTAIIAVRMLTRRQEAAAERLGASTV
jgi:Domain of unknown function (DUF4328)